MIQLKTCKIRYLPPRALKGTTWIPRGPPSLGTCTSFTISLWDNMMNEGAWTWTITNRNSNQTKHKTAMTQTHNKQQRRTKRKIPPGTHTYTYTFWNRSMAMRAHSTLHTCTLVWWHGVGRGEQSSEIATLKMTQHRCSRTTLFCVVHVYLLWSNL